MLDWKQLVRESDEQLASHDLAEIHFACAAGLPGAERIDVPSYLQKLDSWTWHIRKTTDRLTPQFERQPERFAGSRGYFRMMVLVTVLQRDFGVRATNKLNGDNPDCKFNGDDPDCSDSRDLFLHGLLEGLPGTCSSLPILFAAIGRQLNYPLCFICRPEHLFLRWTDAEGGCFNIECTTRGFFTPPDSYYETWPKPMTPDCLRNTYYMRPLTIRETLSGFLIQRAYCLLHNERHREAVEASCWSNELAPHHWPHARTLQRLMARWDGELKLRMPPPFPFLRILCPQHRFTRLPQAVSERLIYLEALDTLWKNPDVQKAYQQPVCRSVVSGAPLGLPERIIVKYSEVSGNEDRIGF